MLIVCVPEIGQASLPTAVKPKTSTPPPFMQPVAPPNAVATPPVPTPKPTLCFFLSAKICSMVHYSVATPRYIKTSLSFLTITYTCVAVHIDWALILNKGLLHHQTTAPKA